MTLKPEAAKDCTFMNMHGLTFSQASQSLFWYPHHPSRSTLYLQNQANFWLPRCYGGDCNLLVFAPHLLAPIFGNFENSRRGKRHALLKASGRESPYEVLGVASSATVDDIKRAYRKLALKYHPDVNREKNAQEKFMKIKHAYNTLVNPESWRKYDAGKSSGFSYSNSQSSQWTNNEDEEDSYEFGIFLRDVQITIEDFFRDIQEEFQSWEASAASQGKPKSLWEELADIGEEFMEYLEKELNITESDAEANNIDGSKEAKFFSSPRKTRTGDGIKNEHCNGSNIEININEIEATLAKLKKELGL